MTLPFRWTHSFLKLNRFVSDRLTLDNPGQAGTRELKINFVLIGFETMMTFTTTDQANKGLQVLKPLKH